MTKTKQVLYQGTVIDVAIPLLHLLYCVLPLFNEFLSFIMNPIKILCCFIQFQLSNKEQTTSSMNVSAFVNIHIENKNLY